MIETTSGQWGSDFPFEDVQATIRRTADVNVTKDKTQLLVSVRRPAIQDTTVEEFGTE